MFAMNIRKAKTDDLPLLIAFDQSIHTDAARQAELKSAIISGACWVFTDEGKAAAYAILDQNFFHHPRIRTLFVSQGARRKGAASRLIRHMETVCGHDRIFIGAPAGNTDMTTLLTKLDYICCGEINGIADDDAPELIYMKRLAVDQMVEPMPLFAAQA